MQNLVIGVVGNKSLHPRWINKNHDLFLVYYEENKLKKEKYKEDADHYDELTGTKFNIIHKLYQKHQRLIDKYDYVFIPDDDLLIDSNEIDRLFDIMDEYKILLSQPSVMGYFSLPITLSVPCNLLRYTNYVEIMCPCFSIEVFKKLHWTFNFNRSSWGIDLLWNLELGSPKNKIAIIDDVVAIHTRPVYNGDNYSNNQIVNPFDDILEICDLYDTNYEKHTYEEIKKDMSNPGERKLIYPNNPQIMDMFTKKVFI